MKKINMLLLTLIGLMISPMLGQQQQQNSCLFEETQQEFYKQNPKAFQQAKEFEKIVQKQIQLKKTGVNKSAQRYIIPVVYHVYGTRWPSDSDGNIREVTDERIKESLKSINEDFKGFNDAVDPAFRNIEGGMNMEFRLAQIDPDGNTTTGIIYHENKEGFGLNGTNDAEIAKYAWDNYKYFNVHIQLILKAGSENNSGIAWFPSKGMSDEGTARVVYNGKYIIYSPPASSLTHEFGHFFGLHHTFNGGCVSGADKGDLVADTPPTAAGTASAPGGRSCETGVRNCFNNLINHENHMDYNPCESMFTKGQIARMESFMNHESRVTLWQDANLTATGIRQNLGARVLFTYQDRKDSDIDKTLDFIEDFNNNGTIMNKKRLKAVDGARFAVTGQLQEGVHFSTSNVPSGLTTRINVENNEIATISFVGNARNHEQANSAEIKITLLNPAIAGGVNSLFSKTGTYRINFLDTYKPYYEIYTPHLFMGYSADNLPATVPTKYNSLIIGGRFRTKLRVFDGNTLTIDNGSMNFEVLCNSNSVNVKYNAEGANISGSSSGTWVKKSTVITDSPPIITSASYTNWYGKTGYAAIRVPTPVGSYVYGWLKIKVNSNGEIAEITTFGLNPDPGKGIAAKVGAPHLQYSGDRFLESASNSGAIANEITVDLKEATFASSGNLVQGTHYTIQNVPSGLQFKATVVNSRRLRLTMQGNAASHDWNAIRDIRLRFLDTAFSSGSGSSILFKEFTLNVEYIGQSYANTLTGKIFTAGTGNQTKAGFYIITSNNIERTPAWYQMQEYEKSNTSNKFPGVKLITWRKDAVANANYELIPLNAGTVIGPGSPWKNGREYHKGRGQHMIDSDSYTAWRGRTKYIGVRVRRSGRMHYGWIKMRVSSQGRTFEFLEYGFSGIPETSIKAGSVDSGSGSTCNDGIQNGNETGVDCGGSCTPCQVEPTCNDGIQNGNETGVDCGGSCTPCQVAPTCNDGIQNGNETGVDCGGSCIPCNTTDNGVVYVNMNDVTADSSSSWNFFKIEVGDDSNFGAWFANNRIQLVAYNKDVVCEGTSSNATLLGEGVQIGSSSNFVTNPSYIISSSSYNNWNGRSGYIGFTYKVNGNTHYGWFYATVANDGLSYTILDYAYNTNAGQALVTKRPAKQKKEEINLENVLRAYPNPFEKTVTIDVSKLEGDAFTVKVYNILGKELSNEKYSKNPGKITLKEQMKSPGNYFVKIQTNEYTKIVRLVKY